MKALERAILEDAKKILDVKYIYENAEIRSKYAEYIIKTKGPYLTFDQWKATLKLVEEPARQ